jgi:hypothetical protein
MSCLHCKRTAREYVSHAIEGLDRAAILISSLSDKESDLESS